MYYPDLSLYQFADPATHDRNIVVYNIGWLDREHSYHQGYTPKEFLERLWLFRKEVFVNSTWGYHECELCENPSFGVHIKHGDRRFSLGASEIRVVSSTGIVYASPDLILHYISEHKYLPPSEFIEAVMTGPLSSTSSYKSVIKVDLE